MGALNVPLKYWLAGIGANLLWGFYVIPVSVLRSAAYPTQEIMLGRITCTIILLMTYLLLVKRDMILDDYQIFKKFTKKEKVFFLTALILSGLALFGNWTFFLYVVQVSGVKGGALLYLSTPIVTAFLGFIVLKEKRDIFKITSLVIVASIITFLGHGSFRDILPILSGALCFGFYVILQKKLPQISRITIFAFQLFVMFSAILPLAHAQYSVSGLPGDIFFWLDCVVIGSLFTILPITLNLFSLIKLPASTVAIFMYITPILAFLIGLLYFHEKISYEERTAYAVLLFAMILFNGGIIKEVITERWKRRKSLKKAEGN